VTGNHTPRLDGVRRALAGPAAAFTGKGFPADWGRRTRAVMGQAAVPLRIDKISVGGGVGLLVGIVVAAMLVELPVLRWPLGTSVGAGLVFGAGLILWRRR